MKYSTVGELIDALMKIDRSIRLLRADDNGNYYDLDLNENLIFRVADTGFVTGDGSGMYMDALRFDGTEMPNSFDAIVL